MIRAVLALFLLFASVNVLNAGTPFKALANKVTPVTTPSVARVSRPAPSPPTIVGISGCGTQFHNFSIGCYNGNTLTIFVDQFTWIQWVSVDSQYNCTSIKPINDSAIECQAPYVSQGEYNRILPVQVFDQFNGLSDPFFGIEYDNNNNAKAVAEVDKDSEVEQF